MDEQKIPKLVRESRFLDRGAANQPFHRPKLTLDAYSRRSERAAANVTHLTQELPARFTGGSKGFTLPHLEKAMSA